LLGIAVGASAHARWPDRWRWWSSRRSDYFWPKQNHPPISYRRFSSHWLIGFIDSVTRRSGLGFSFETVDIDTAVYDPAVYDPPIDHGVTGNVRGIVDQRDVARAR